MQCKIPDGSYATRNVKEGDNVTKKYVFTKIFSGDASQTQLFCEIVKPKMLKFLNGYNYTLLSYGASGSGMFLAFIVYSNVCAFIHIFVLYKTALTY